MADNKKSFLLYCDIIHTVDKLTDEQAGKLLKHILEYVNDKNPVSNDTLLNIAFEPIKQSLKRDLKRYENICKKNSDNARKRWDAKNATACEPMRDDAKHADIDSDIDSDSDIDNKILYMRDFDLSICKLDKNTTGYKVMETGLRLFKGYKKEYQENKDLGLKTLTEWIKPIRRLMENKKYTQEQIFAVAEYAINDKFWKSRVMDMEKLERNFETIKFQYHEQTT